MTTPWGGRSISLEIDGSTWLKNKSHLSTGQKAFIILPFTHMLSTAACDLFSIPLPTTSVFYVKKIHLNIFYWVIFKSKQLDSLGSRMTSVIKEPPVIWSLFMQEGGQGGEDPKTKQTKMNKSPSPDL